MDTHKPEMVVHPRHYNDHPSGIEVLRYVRDLPLGPGSAVKYVMRRDLKGNGGQDIDKAVFYLTDAIEHRVTYLVSPKVRDLVTEVIAHEPNAMVCSFLHAMYLPRRDGSLFQRLVFTPDMEGARDILGVLREDY